MILNLEQSEINNIQFALDARMHQMQTSGEMEGARALARLIMKIEAYTTPIGVALEDSVPCPDGGHHVVKVRI